MTKSTAYDIVTEQIVQMLDEGTVPWRQPWRNIGLPTSMSTGKPYRGINPFLLNMAAMVNHWTNPHYGTYDQITARGGQVRKGERSNLVVFWKRSTTTVQDEHTGEDKEKAWAILRYFRVFNVEQADWLDGVPTKFEVTLADHEPIEAASDILNAYVYSLGSPDFTEGGDVACYSPALDRITMPVIGLFDTAEAYYSAAFHEAGHSTGHKSRLNREGIIEGHRFGDESYAKEELIAEMTAAMLSAHAGIEQVTLPTSAAYLDHWSKALKSDSKIVVAAAGAAQRAADLILGTTFDTDEKE